MANAPNIPVWQDMGSTPRPDTVRDNARVIIVGAGPVGLTLALDLGRRGHNVVVLNRLDFVAGGSKAICFAKRTLDIFDRLGVGDAIVAKGVVWNTGKVFRGDSDEPVYQFELSPLPGQKRPAFVNIQQYHVECQLVDALALLPNVELRWGHALQGIRAEPRGVEIKITTVDGAYSLDAEWVIAADGARSTLRGLLNLDFEGRVFEDNFLIADVRMQGDRPPERWFWFDPPFHRGQSALLHKQPDDLWRLDFQLGWSIDREACLRDAYVASLVRGLIGESVPFTKEWYSIYTFQCRRMARFVHGRVVFAGDAAHLVSPFGARGCNGGIADADNLGWKLDLVLAGLAPETLIESYNEEAIFAADENILKSTQSTDFMTPKSSVSRAFRDAVLALARDHPFARPMVNSGRLSAAISYPSSSLNTPDDSSWTGGVPPGSPALDAPMKDGWLLDRLGGHFLILAHGVGFETEVPVIDLTGNDTAVARYALPPASAVLIRPDGYVSARWRRPTADGIKQARIRAMGIMQ